MRRKTWLTIVVAAGAVAGLLVFQSAAWTRPDGTPLADKLLTVAHASGTGAILLTVPGPDEARLLGEIAASSAPPDEQERLRQAVMKPAAYRVQSGQVDATTPGTQIIAFEDPATGEEMQLELLTVEVDGKIRYASRPDALPLRWNPAQQNLGLLERNSALFLLDTDKLQVSFLGNSDDRIAGLQAAAQLRAVAAAEEEGPQGLNWGQEAHWSPDGRHIAFLTNRDTLGEHFGTSLWVHDMETGEERVILRGTAGKPAVVRGWTPRNELIVDEYTATNGASRSSLVALGLNGSRRRLSNAAGSFVAQSSDARTLVWMHSRGRENELRTLDLVSGRQKVIWKDSWKGLRLRSAVVEISADGQRLVTDLEDARHAQSLLVYDLRTGKTRIIPVRAGWQISLPASWVGNQLLLPMESRGAVRTFLLNPNEE